MYPCEPFSAAAFMKSASSWIRVSASEVGKAEERTLGRTITAIRSMAARASNFMRPPRGKSATIVPERQLGLRRLDAAKLATRPMKTSLLIFILSTGLIRGAVAQTPTAPTAQPDLATPQEKHLRNVRQ